MSRPLRLTSPHMHGDDVRRLQAALNRRARDRDLPTIHEDGDYGTATASSVRQVGAALGAATSTLEKGATVGLQRIVLHPGLRTPAQLARASAWKRRAAAAKRGPDAALKWAHAQIGTIEHPAGSNSGPKITQWLREVGIGAAAWCGAFAHAVLKAGGLEVTGDVRYVPSIKAHAIAGTGGLEKWIDDTNWKSARRGDLACFDFGGSVLAHVEVVDRVHADGTIETVGGNTSSGPGGSQDNGGGVFARQRNVRDIAGFARPRWA